MNQLTSGFDTCNNMHSREARGDSRADRSYCGLEVKALRGWGVVVAVAAAGGLPVGPLAAQSIAARMRVVARVEQPAVGAGLTASVRTLRAWLGVAGGSRMREGIATLILVSGRPDPSGRPSAVLSIQFLRN